MSRHSRILNVHIFVIGFMGITSLYGMEEHHEEHHELSPEATHTSPSSAPVAAASASAKLVWEDQANAGKSSAEGLTNINEARGNWFFKQQIAKDARKLEERINKKVMAIIPLQEKYLNDHAAVDQAFNTFNVEYGFQGGEIDARLEILLEQIAKLEQTQSAHDPEEVTLLEELKKQKAGVDALKNDFEVLQALDTALSKGLADMSTSITKATSYEDQATTHYEAIYDVLNDQVAEELLKKMQILFDNITAIETYLTGDFNNFFKSTSQKIADQITSVKGHIESLKKEGIALGQKMRDLQAKEDEEFRLKELQEQKKQAEIKEKENRTILSPIFDGINLVWIAARNAISWVVSKIYGMLSWIFGSKTAENNVAKKQEVPQVPRAPHAIEEEPEEPVLVPPVQTVAPIVSSESVAHQPIVPSAPSVNQSIIPPVPSAPVVPTETSVPAVPVTTPAVSTPVTEPVPSVTPLPVTHVSAPVDDHPYVPRAVTTEPYVPTSVPAVSPVVAEVHHDVHEEEHHEAHEHGHKAHTPESVHV